MSHVVVMTQHGETELEGDPESSIGDVLRRAGILWSAVWTYLPGQDGKVKFVPLGTRLDALSGSVIARANRNVDLLGLSHLMTGDERDVADATTEWIFPGVGGGAYECSHARLSQEDCLAIAQQAVDQVLGAWPEDLPRRVVIGTSGGGDSNVLLTALVRSGQLALDNIVPVMLFSPDMVEHRRSAHELCHDLGLSLIVLEPEQIAPRAGVRSVEAFFAEFESAYPDADIDFAWTWLLRRTLAAAARERGISAVAVGANREDLLSEGFLRLARGLPPMPAPYRRIGTETFVYPMCHVPKKIGDGAYPRRSLANYKWRQASVASGRTVFYQLAYLLADHLPGMDVTLLDGFNRLGTEQGAHSDPVIFESTVGDYITDRMSTHGQRQKWAEFLARVGGIGTDED